jgi:hypothetical protein
MPRVKRGGYVFLVRKGDHSPKHVHVYRDGVFVLKWNLEAHKAIVGRASRRLQDLIRDLRSEGLL